MLNSLDPNQAQRFVGPDLGPNCLQRLSAPLAGKEKNCAPRVNTLKKQHMDLNAKDETIHTF